MDYFDIIKRAFTITWRYKMLWVLGLFAGTVSSNSSVRNAFQNNNSSGNASDPFTNWVSQNTLYFAIVAGILLIVGLVFWVVSLMAQGGLVFGGNEAAEGRRPMLGQCWGVGFGKIGRTFMIGLVVALPAFLVAAVLGVLIAILGFGGYVLGRGTGAAAGGVVAVCLILPVFVAVVIALAIVMGIIYPLALRYGVLQNITFGEAIKRGWYDLRAKRGAFVFWLVMLIPGFIAGAVMALIAVPFLVPAVVLIVAEKWVLGVALAILGGLVLLIPSSVYSTFVSVAWTLFFRAMNGLDVATVSAPSAPGYTPPPPPSWDNAPVPPASYPAPAPPAPPIVPPAPPAPPSAPPAPPSVPPAPPAPPSAPPAPNEVPPAPNEGGSPAS